MSREAASPPVRFLQSLGKLVTSAGLYPGAHPARRDAVHDSFEALGAVLADRSPAVFSFLEEEVIFGREPLRELGVWPWSPRLFEVGVQRLEIREGVEAAELEAFAADLAVRLGLVAAKREEARKDASGAVARTHPHIVYGELGVRRAGKPAESTEAPPLDLREEAETVQWIHQVAAEKEEVPEAETAAIVGALLVAVRSARELVAPLLQIQETDQYTTTHCLNVSLLSMSLAEYLRLSDEDVLAVGEAGLLHDIGKCRIPPAILNKPGRLTPQERAVVEHHVVEGARMLIGSEQRNALSAVVAYEHHMHWNGEAGYPKPGVPHTPHRFSRLVHVCDVFDALRTRRPWRPPLTAEAVLAFLAGRAGSEFDPELVEGFLQMMRRWEPNLVGHGADEEGPEEADPSRLEELVGRSEEGFDADTEGELYGR